MAQPNLNPVSLTQPALLREPASAGGAAGDAAFWWSVQGDWVEAPNQRRGGFSGVQRVCLSSGECFYVKRQRNHLFRSARYPGGRPTLLREWRSMQFCARVGVPTAIPVFFEMQRCEEGWDSILVTRDLRGYVSLDKGFAAGVWDSTQRATALRAVAKTLLILHLARRKHGHLYPKEVFVDLDRREPVVAVVDWELSRYRLTPTRAAEPDVRRLMKSLLNDALTRAELALFLDIYRQNGIELGCLAETLF